MAVWQSILVTMVRSIIGDTSQTPALQSFSDDRILTAIGVAALIATSEHSFTTDYVVDLENIDITPDPANADTYDPTALALFSLKASCMLNIDQFQAAVRNGIDVRDGDTAINTTATFGGYQDILRLGPCQSYQLMLEKSQIASSAIMVGGRAVISVGTHVDGSYGVWSHGRWSVGGWFDTFLGAF